jgi:hypothetical protein
MTMLDEIYTTLKDHGFCADQQDFSREWLGRSEGYYAYLRSSGARPSTTSLALLAARIFGVVPRVSVSPLLLSSGPLRSAWVAATTLWQGERKAELQRRYGRRCTFDA